MAGMFAATACCPRHRRGFTLVEQIVALAVAAILVALAVPSMANLVARTAIGATRDTFFTAAHMARNTAILHDTHVLLCPSADGNSCSGDSNWQQGWIVALDRDHDEQPDAGVLYSGKPGTHVRVVGSSGRRYVRFRPDGDAAGTNLTLLVCRPDGSSRSAEAIVISNFGRIREQHASKQQRERCVQHD